ncbi:DNA repair and recombination protein RadB [Halodesulfurarchaeum formicicum]|uniref:DNA repair and recombination protein RadB n=1 Tax=Halodesulfurarchaeum formicicum TaxID=1873524 RepID=A0A1D8S2B9_9EURY|nr:DNA repair and recombination protein RadB [Halodesulfurarchaeum formicicum]AOW79512.1 DNA repair and recombination protein RadB [Halodesulfurarchaeum formicicum]
MTDDVPTGCGALDDLLGGGFERGTATQLYGPPGAGKTNLALSASVAVAKAGGEALYVDTEGLSVERFEQILDGQTDEAEAVARNIVVTEATDFEEQAEAVRDAAEFAERMDLIVLDSATGFYRLKRTGDAERGDTLRAVADQVTHLLALARKHDLAVVLTNQVFSDPESESGRPKPLGGHTLSHWTGTIVRLDRYKGGNRRAILEKHRAKPEGEQADFQITGAGIEDAERR